MCKQKRKKLSDIIDKSRFTNDLNQNLLSTTFQKTNSQNF
jgi:hypothetical protein